MNNNLSLSNIINNNFSSEKEIKIMDNNKIYCCNCGKYGHIYRKCKYPITSIGIINLYLSDIKLHHYFANKYVIKNIINKYKQNNYEIKNIFLHKFNQKNNSIFNNQQQIEYFLNIVKDKIKILMIRRKNSLGYIEFVRGRYNVDNINEILNLFNQMITDEINFIKNNNNFDIIWNNLWNGKYSNLPIDSTHLNELLLNNESELEKNLNKLSNN